MLMKPHDLKTHEKLCLFRLILGVPPVSYDQQTMKKQVKLRSLIFYLFIKPHVFYRYDPRTQSART